MVDFRLPSIGYAEFERPVFWLNIDACTPFATLAWTAVTSGTRTSYDFWQLGTISKVRYCIGFYLVRHLTASPSNSNSWHYSAVTPSSNHRVAWMISADGVWTCVVTMTLAYLLQIHINFVFLVLPIRYRDRNMFIQQHSVCSWSNTFNSW